MLLAHKPALLPMSPPSAHRRHPSAPPAVVVQPTKVPGILSVARPLRPDHPRQQHHSRHPHRAPRPKQQPRTDEPRDKPATLAADRQPRSRPPKTPKDNAGTSTSAHAHSRRNNVRQPSPPIHASQVEGPTLSRTPNPAANSFDPFLVSSDSDSDNSPRPFPSAKHAALPVPPPSGKARRRNHTAQPATPSPAPRPVPVPAGRHPTHRNNLSRSAPNPQALPPIDKRRASGAYATDFPVCDDTTDVEDTSPPSTPTRDLPAGSTWQRLSLDGPRTAPLSSFSGFSFASPADSTPSRTRHLHHRTPSEGIFNMSFDEDVSLDAPEELKKLFGFPSKPFASLGSSSARAPKDKAGFFASSVFQNSPSPDELPPPAF